MTIRFRLQTGDLISFNKHVISGVESERKAVVGISKVKDRGILLCFSHSFILCQGISIKLFDSCPRVNKWSFHSSKKDSGWIWSKIWPCVILIPEGEIKGGIKNKWKWWIKNKCPLQNMSYFERIETTFRREAGSLTMNNTYTSTVLGFSFSHYFERKMKITEELQHQFSGHLSPRYHDLHCCMR